MIHNRWICRLKIKNEKPCSPVYFDKAMDLVGRWHKMRDEYAICPTHSIFCFDYIIVVNLY
jgi:hypothetical protein